MRVSHLVPRVVPGVVPGIILAAVLGLAACQSGPEDPPQRSAAPQQQSGAGDVRPAPMRLLPLRASERRVALEMPEPYTPSAPSGVGADDYRCFLLDPGLEDDAFITGTAVAPGNADAVHHVILFRLDAELVDEAEELDEEASGPGWTCFGDSGVRDLRGGPMDALDSAPWLGAWAPGSGETVFRDGLGVPVGAGSRIVMQVHYNLLRSGDPDVSATHLRLARPESDLAPVTTMLLPAPVELPCRPGHDQQPLCDRAAALDDVQQRFGVTGGFADWVHLLCGPLRPGEVQTCDRRVREPATVVGVAGHMHLLGRQLTIEVNPGTARERTLLRIDPWNFDDQAAQPISPVRLGVDDTLRVTCRHVQWLRDLLPEFAGQPDRYVLWGDGTTDEMCLGVLQVITP